MKKNTNGKTSGCIIAANDDTVTIRFSEDVSSCRNDQPVIVSIPYERKTALGKVMNVAEIVAHGKISNVSDNVIVIHSKRNNPIISKAAICDSLGKERTMFIEILH